MEVVAAEMNIALMTDFWTSPIAESFMMMSMHWITQGWDLKTHILGMTNFQEDHTAMKISDMLMDLHLEFNVYPKNSDGKTPL